MCTLVKRAHPTLNVMFTGPFEIKQSDNNQHPEQSVVGSKDVYFYEQETNAMYPPSPSDGLTPLRGAGDQYLFEGKPRSVR